MSPTELSPREKEIVALSAEGLTNAKIAEQLGLSVGTIDSYWMRIKHKVGGIGRTDTVLRIVTDEIKRALQDCNEECEIMARRIADHEGNSRSVLALLHLAMDQFKSTAWVTDLNLSVQIVTDGVGPSQRFGLSWSVGKTVHEIFDGKDSGHMVVGCHLRALQGEDCNASLDAGFANTILRVAPLKSESGEITGCISILDTVVRAEA